jgi:hypothetical protein
MSSAAGAAASSDVPLSASPALSSHNSVVSSAGGGESVSDADAEERERPPAAADAALEAIRLTAISTTVAREKLLLSRIKEVQARIAHSLKAKRAAAAAAAAHGTEVPASAAAAASASALVSTAGPAALAEVPPAASAAEPSPHPEVDRGVAFLKSRLDSMLVVLEEDIMRAEQGLGHALRVADTDKDGEVSEAELRDALARLGGGEHAEEAAAALISRLDSNGDGDVTVEALERYLEQFSAVLARVEERKSDVEGGGVGASPPLPAAAPGGPAA